MPDLIRSAEHTQLAPGLSEADAERVLSYAEADLSDQTKRNYAMQWRQFVRWADERGVEALPATPGHVAAYLTERAPDRSVSWVGQAAAAIKKAHERRGLESPTRSSGVERTLKGIRRIHGEPAQPKAAARTIHIKAMVDAIKTPAPSADAGPAAVARYLRSIRNRAILLFGYAAALRRSELAAACVEHVSFNEDGLEIRIPRSKGDQEGKGDTVGVAYGNGHCPVRALRAWMDAAGIEAGPIFRPVPRNAEVKKKPITGRTVRNVVRDAAEAAGLDYERFAGHSLRRGHITEGALNGATLARLQQQARHADPRTTAGYIEDAERMKTTTSRNLGL